MNEELMAIEKNNIMTQIVKVVPNQNYGRMLVINSDFIIINSDFIIINSDFITLNYFTVILH